MMRLSPFRENRHYSSLKDGGTNISRKSIKNFNRPKDRENFAARFENRINIWPFVYREGDFTSLMWPFADIDPYGVAIRPFYNQEGNEYSIMFPLSAWNPVNNNGWAAPYYWNRAKGFYGAAPFFHVKYNGDTFQEYLVLGGLLNHYSVNGKNNYSFSLLNYLQSRNGQRSFNTFIPLYLFKSKPNAWSFFMLPSFYVCKAKNTSSSLCNKNKTNTTAEIDDRLIHTLLPLYYYNYSGYENYYFWLLNLYYNRHNDDLTHAFVPLYLYKKDDKEQVLWILNFLYSQNKQGNGSMLFPLYLYNNKADKEKLLWILNFMYSKKAQETGSTLFPLYFYNNKDDKEKLLWILNFIYSKKGQETGSTLFPLYFYNNKDDKEKLLWILNFIYSKNEQETGSILFPLYFYNNKVDKEKLLWILNFMYRQKGQETGNALLPLYFYNKNPEKHKEKFLILGGILSYFHKNDLQITMSILNFYKDNNNHAFIPIYWYNHSANKDNLNILGLSGLSHRQDKLQRLYALPLFWYERDSALWVFPYFQRSADSRYYNGILPVYLYKKTPSFKELLVYPLLCSFTSGKDYCSGNILFPFGGYSFKRNSSSSYFWPLYSYKQAQDQNVNASGPFVLKYVNSKYHSPALFNTFSSEDCKKAKVPANTRYAFDFLLYGYDEKKQHILNYGRHENFIPFTTRQNDNYMSRISVFPFFTTTRKEQRWDFSKINPDIINQINKIAAKIEIAEQFEKNFQYYKELTNHSSRNYLKRQLKDQFKLKLDINKPFLPQLNSYRKIMAERKKIAFADLKTIFERNSCKTHDTSKCEILKGLYNLQNANSYQYTTKEFEFFPVFSWKYSPDSWRWWFTIAYANRNKGQCYDQIHLNQIFDGKIKKLPSNDSFGHGVFPLYFYSSKPQKASLTLPAFLSWYNSKKIDPDCGFPERVFGDAMKQSGLKNGKEASAYWLLFCHTSSSSKDAILPMPTNYSNKVVTKSSDQFFWLYNNWSKQYKMWDYEKVKQQDIKEVMSSVAALIDLDYWNIEKLNSFPDLKVRSYSLGYKYRRKKMKPEERKRQIKITVSKLSAQLNKLGFKDIDLKDRTALFKALYELDKRYTVEARSGTTIIPLLYYRNYDRDKDYWNILLLLSDYKREKDYSKFAILKYLFRVEQDKQRYNCDVFPFINYSSRQDQSSFSFMWRLFRIEKQKGKVSKLYLGFIPFKL